MAATKLSELLKAKEVVKSEHKRKSSQDQVIKEGVDIGYRNDTSITKKQTFKEIDPSRCRPWIHHNRSTLWLNSEKCGSLIESIRRDGQQELGLVRLVKNDPQIDYEIIYGVRRWWSCSQIEGRKFKARITNADDQECARLMHLENAESKDITDFERACSFKHQLDCGIFSNKKTLAEKLDVSNALVTRMYKAASIMEFPFIAALLENFILDIPVKQASDLYELLVDHGKATDIEKAANTLKLRSANAGVSGSTLIRDLIRAVTPLSSMESRVLLQNNGRDLVSLKRSKSGQITIVIDKKVSRIKKDGLRKEIKEALNSAVDELV